MARGLTRVIHKVKVMRTQQGTKLCLRDRTKAAFTRSLINAVSFS